MNGEIGLRKELLLYVTSKYIHRNLAFRYRIFLIDKPKISYSEKSSIGSIILVIAFLFEEDLVKYELVYARSVILKVVSLV